ncbi:AraC family transcriptional regulator [Sabulibacter ruber]|uniref:AraC family transcriptional regulator n=1 Tax=Sabulibacter ruber TaxID=2811901 RepID=UPI001A960D28|nr:GyrI-like domain-containing protein [Sabulibacter ruber]
MSKPVQEQSIGEYFARVNKAIDYIRLHLGEDLSLDAVAERSHFSKFHFHRVFKATTGKTLSRFMRDARVERAAFYLTHSPSAPVGEIAFLSGFANETSFFRTFKDARRMTPIEYRESLQGEDSKICKEEGNKRDLHEKMESYLASRIHNLKETSMEKGISIEVEVKDLPELHVVYLRNLNIHLHDSEAFGSMFEALMRWAAPRGLVNFPETKALTVYRSNPNPSGFIQADVCLTVPEGTLGEGIIGSTVLTGGKYAVVRKEATMAECFSAWDYVFQEWLPGNGYQPDSRNFYISHLNEPEKHPQKLHIFDMCIPVKPL